MRRRIFIAIDLPPELKAKVGEAIAQWRFLPIRWLPPENWHVTLVPPVYLEDAEISALSAILGKRRLGESFLIRFSRVLLAPPGQTSRMIWLEGETPPELGKLKKKLEKLWASQPGLPPLKPESRPLHLHLTLARFEPGELRELEQKTRVLGDVDFAFEVKEITVMESHLKPTGVEYEKVATVAL